MSDFEIAIDRVRLDAPTRAVFVLHLTAPWSPETCGRCQRVWRQLWPIGARPPHLLILQPGATLAAVTGAELERAGLMRVTSPSGGQPATLGAP